MLLCVRQIMCVEQSLFFKKSNSNIIFLLLLWTRAEDENIGFKSRCAPNSKELALIHTYIFFRRSRISIKEFFPHILIPRSRHTACLRIAISLWQCDSIFLIYLRKVYIFCHIRDKFQLGMQCIYVDVLCFKGLIIIFFKI